MIIAELNKSVSYMGCLDPGTELVASLRAICVEKSIHSGFISGYGYIVDPEFLVYSRSEKTLSTPHKQEGIYVTSSLHGSVSLGEDNQLDLTLFCEASASGLGRSKSVSGRLYAATVHLVEFVILPVSGLVFRRMQDENAGLGHWLQMLPDGAQYAPAPAPAVANRRELASRPATSVEDELEEVDDDVNLSDGDWLNHPRLGMCLVVKFDGEERVKVRLQSGRLAELMLSMFRLHLGGIRDGARVWDVQMRGRKGS